MTLTTIAGNASAQVYFTVTFSSAPVVVATARANDPTGIIYVTEVTTTYFIIKIAGSSISDGNITVGWVAVEP